MSCGASGDVLEGKRREAAFAGRGWRSFVPRPARQVRVLTFRESGQHIERGCRQRSRATNEVPKFL